MVKGNPKLKAVELTIQEINDLELRLHKKLISPIDTIVAVPPVEGEPRKYAVFIWDET